MRKVFTVVALLICTVVISAEPLVLTTAEQDFINAHPVIRIGVDPAFIPFEFIDDEGKYQGVSSDIIQYVAEQTGLEFALQQDLSWQEVTAAVQAKHIDVLPAAAQTEERNSYLLFTRSYITFQRAAVVKDTNESINSFDDLFGRQVAVQANSSHYGFLVTYPEIILRTYDTVEEALDAVYRGDEVVFVGNEATTSYLASAQGMTGLRFITLPSQGVQQLHMAVRNDWPQLVSILDKALATLDEAHLAEIYDRWITHDRRIDYTPFILAFGVILGIFFIMGGVSAYWIIRLKREIAQKEQAQQEMKEATMRAEAADREKSRFMARMSHEIRTPLNGINGMTFLLEGTKLDAVQKRHLATISRASQSMLSIINDIIDYSRIEERRISLERIPFKLDEVIQHIISLEMHSMQEKDLHLQLEWESDVPVHVIGDSNRVGQILTNLIHNAIKFTEKGTIGIRVSCADLQESSCRIVCEVSDTGIGMTAQEQEKLFKPFGQADASIARRYGGFGLGLSIVKSLVELRQGSLEVFSEWGMGSTFTLELPFDRDQSGANEDNLKLQASGISDLPILICAKDETIRKAIEIVLRRIGSSGDYIGSSAMIMQLMSNADVPNRYRLIIADYAIDNDMPSTIPLLQQLDAKVLVFVEGEDALHAEEIRASGADIVLPKPVLPSLVFDSLIELFSNHNPERQTSEIASSVTVPQTEQTILVVEDNRVNQTIAKEILKQSGYEVIIAENGKVGVDQFVAQRERIHLILMDLHMDVMDGFAAMEKIREIDTEIPVFALTADVIGDTRQRCRDAGFTRIVSKPYQPKELIDLIRATLPFDSEPSLPVLDTVRGTRMVGDNSDLYRKMVRLFLQEIIESMEDLEKAIEQNQWEEIGNIAHKIKGGAASIGAERVTKRAKQIQILGSQRATGITDEMKKLRQDIDELLATSHIFLEKNFDY